MRQLKPTRLSQDALTRILEVTAKLAAPYELLHMLTEVVQAGQSVLSADRGSLWLYHPETDELQMRVPEIKPAPRMKAGVGLVGECLESREIINVTDAYGDPRFRVDTDRATGYKTESILSVPLLGRDQEPVGVLQLLNKHNGVFDSNDELVAKALAAQCALAVQRTQMVEALILKERLDEEVALAREIQMSTFPEVMPEVPGYDLHGEFRPADQTGGDMYDLVMLGGKLFILMGDATGHGMGPAISATQMQAMLRVAFRCGADLNAAYRHVNNQLAEDLPEDRFLTAFMGFLDHETNEVLFHSGGQGPILHYRAAASECVWLKPTSFPVGILELDDPGEPSSIILEPGDILALVSDGIYEFENRQGAQFGDQGVGSLIGLYHHLPMAKLGEHLLRAVFEHGAGVQQADDITVVLIRRLPD
jgi:phosphoserine phosphatase